MVGASAQLAATGAADQYLSGSPQITYFKQIWRRYTQYAMESIEQSWTGTVDFGRKATVALSKAGDLVTEVWLQVTLPDLVGLNHITNATRLATEPAVFYARNTSATDLKIDAFTCDGASDYVLLARTSASVVSAVVPGLSQGVTVSFTVQPSGPELVPLSGTGAPILMTGAGTEYAAEGLEPGVAYAVRSAQGDTSLTSIVQLQTSDSATVSFSLSNVDARETYTVRVSCILGGQPATSSTQTALKAKWCNSVGHALLSSVEWEMGGSRIDRHTGEHFDLLSELTEPAEKRAGYSDMIGRYDDYDLNDDSKSSAASKTLYIPLRFSFNTNASSALPLLALQFHDCRLNFEFRSFLECIRTNVPLVALTREPGMVDAKLFATYVFLSQEERMRFAEMPHEYLIEQLQAQVENVAAVSNTDGVVNRKIQLNLNHPVKELLFVYHANDNITKDPVGGNQWFDYDIPGQPDEEIIEEANIQLNGHDRFVKMPAKYWRLMVPYRHHTRVPSKKVHCYSFALTPESPNPSGAANFSRIDQAHLSMMLNPHLPAGRIRIHAIGYNILRIAQGLSGLVFAG
jgi:hypothetical protein